MVGADAAATEAKRGIELEPNSADGYLALAQVLVKGGKHEEAIDAVTTAKRLDPQNTQIYDRWEGQAQVLLGRFEEAAATLRQVIQFDPEDIWSHMWLGAAYVGLGRDDEGREEIVRLNAMRKERSGRGPISTSFAASFHLVPVDTDKLRASLGATGVGAWSRSPRALPSGIRLKGGELLALFRLPYWYGGDPGSNTEHWMIRNPQNESELGGSWENVRFPPDSIENDQICAVIVGQKFCGIV